MGITAHTASLLFKIDGDSSQLKKELQSVDAAFNSLASKAGSLAGVATIAAAGVAAIATAAVATAAAIFRLTVSSAEYASAIFDAQEKTGLAAAELSTLKAAADNAGSSFEQVTTGVAKFAKLLGQARDGNEEAQATLKSLGVTTYDLNEALSQATKTISDAKTGTDQIVLSQKAFGKSGADLIPVIKQMGGDLAAATKEADRLGLTMSDKDIRAADAFGDSLGILGQQAKVAGVRFTSDLMPVLTHYFTMATEWFARNQEVIRVWGFAIARTFQFTAALISNIVIDLRKQMAIVTLGMSELAIKAAQLYGDTVYKGFKRQMSHVQEGGGGGGVETGIPDVSSSKPDKGNAARDAERAAKEAYQENVAMARRLLAEKESIARRIVANYEWQESQGLISAQQLADQKILLENKLLQFRLQTLQKELALAEQFGQKQLDLLSQIEIAKTEIETKGLQDLTAANKKAAEQTQQDWEDAMKASQAAFDAFMYDVEHSKEKQEDDTQHGSAKIAAIADAPNGTPYDFGNIGDSWATFRDSVMQDAPLIGEVLANLGQVGWNALNQLAQGLGQVIQNWVLTGGSIGKAMKQMVASVLAGVAAQAAVLAIFELAKGFAALFWNPAEAAAHFQAAALFSIVAVGAGAGGRAAAGSFQQQTANGGAGGGSQQTSRGDKFTEAFSGFGQRMDRMNERLNTVLGGVEEQLHNFATKFSAVTPGHVVMAGAGDGAQAIFDAHTSVLGSGGNATESMVRAQGRFR